MKINVIKRYFYINYCSDDKYTWVKDNVSIKTAIDFGKNFKENVDYDDEIFIKQKSSFFKKELEKKTKLIETEEIIILKNTTTTTTN